MDKHFDRIFPFITERQPDAMCIQELFDDDRALWEQTFPEYTHQFIPMAIYQRDDGTTRTIGIAIFTKHPAHAWNYTYYVGTEDTLPTSPYVTERRPMNRALMWTTVTKDATDYIVANTHFTITAKGQSTPEQRADLESMQNILNVIPNVILCGDFNAPRGRETFDQLAQTYTDNIPPHIQTTLDEKLHSAARENGQPLLYVVDGLFTSSAYTAMDVDIISGLSDHKAIIASIHTKDS